MTQKERKMQSLSKEWFLKRSRPFCSLTAAVVSEISETILLTTRAIMAVDDNPLASENSKTTLLKNVFFKKKC